MKRFVLLALLVVTAVILQSALLSRIRLFGVAPDVIALTVIALAILEGPFVGAASGFGGGVLRDVLLETPAGLSSISYLTVGYAVGSIRPYVQSTSVLVPIAAVGLGTLASGAFYVLLTFLLGGPPEPLERVARVVGLTAVYNALLTPIFFPLIRRLSSLAPRERLFR
ncbi:MAG: rod shape-determining protein MreD [Actinomycetota bacterium]